jgi:CubicO group peptidase (beta-lactamase class C family)
MYASDEEELTFMATRCSRPQAVVLGALLVGLAACALVDPATPTTDAELARYADELMKKMYPADEPGAAILVARHGKVLLRKGYGLAEMELGVPVRPEMVFELGSVTKQFTAAAILMLQEQGKLSVHDEITRYLPDYPTHSRKITLEHLLTHVSGIPSYTDLPEWVPKVREDITVEQLVDLFKDKPLEFNPGERWAYSNSAYILLGAVIEKVSGQSYEDFVEQEIFAPLGMKHSLYGHYEELVPGRVEGYEPAEHGYRRARYVNMAHPYAAGSLMSSVDDLWLWEQGLASGKLLRQESLDRLFTPARLSSGANTHYAYGWHAFDYAGHKVMDHGGDIFGFVAHVARVPDQRFYVAVLSNNYASNPQEVGLRIAAKAVGAALEDRPAIDLDERTLEEYVGVYRFDPRTTRTVTREGGRLFSQRNGAQRQEVLASARDEFFFKEAPSRLRFRRDAQGRVTGMDFMATSGPDGFGTRTEEAPGSERQAVRVDPALYDAYAGVYELAPGFQITVTREGDQLFGQPTGQSKAELFPTSETEFFLRVDDVQISFQRGADGKATGLVMHQGGRDTPGKRVQ